MIRRAFIMLLGETLRRPSRPGILAIADEVIE
jgi:hypothetical protein